MVSPSLHRLRVPQTVFKHHAPYDHINIMSSTTLAAPQIQASQTPAPGSLTVLSIDADTLLDNLLDQQLSADLYISSSNLTVLSIGSMAGCSSKLTEGLLNKLFEFLQSLTKLTRLSISGFTLGGASTTLPTRLWASPIFISEVTVANTHGASLSYLLQCIQPRELRLVSCWFIQNLPSCERLTLTQVQPFDGFSEVLSTWDGDRLHIEHSPFFDEVFVQDLCRRMEESEQPIWPRVCVSHDGCSLALRIKMVDFLVIRSRLL
jgi:hypothetical protein